MRLLYNHWGKLVAAGILLAGIFVWLLPTMLAYGPLRSAILRGVLEDRVVVRIETLSLGWFQPTKIGGLEVEDAEDRYQITVAEINNDVAFWRLIANPRKLGNLIIDGPETHLHLRGADDHLIEFRDRTDSPLDRDKLVAALDRSIRVRVSDASFHVHHPASEDSWQIPNVNLEAELVPSTEHQAGTLLRIPRAQFMNRLELTEGMSDDLLKFAAPIFHRVANTSGQVSLRVSEMEIPLSEHEKTTGKGTLQIHQARLHSGPLAERIVNLLGLPETVEVVTDCTIDFEIAAGRVYHEGLDFGIGNFRVRTRGYVGFDESLDLICEIPIPDNGSDVENRPLLAALRGKTLEIPITGTLDRPEIDPSQIGQSIRDLAGATLRDLSGSAGEAGELFNEQGEIILGEAISTAEGLLRELDLGEGQLLDRFRQGRDERRQDPAQPGNEAPRRGGLLDRFRQRREDPSPPPPPPPTPQESEAIDL
ncbi:MAG: hypothetical protein WD045_17910 [Pirellulaceae bacterium]